MHFQESPPISSYPNTDSQEPGLSHYKVCCNIVNCSNFPPHLFLKSAEIMLGERKTRNLGRALQSETAFSLFSQVEKSQVFSDLHCFTAAFTQPRTEALTLPLDLCGCWNQNFRSHRLKNFMNVTSGSKINHHSGGPSQIQKFLSDRNPV